MFGRSPDAASKPFVASAVPFSMIASLHKLITGSPSAGTVHRKSGGFGASGLLLALFAALTGSIAQAQVQIQTVVVLDFSTVQGVDPILGRKAADALAVELQRTGDYEVVPRQQVEQAVSTQPGLAPPYNESTQARLAQAVNARAVFSGQVLGAQVNNGRSARVALEVRLLDSPTQDYINGTQVSESTEDQLTQMTAEVLIDQALNKAAVTAVRKIKQQPVPFGTVLNTTVSDAELNIGARVGTTIGQRYSVLRDVYNRSKDRVERIKIGEVVVTKVEMDQSVARIAGENVGGVKTGDKVRLIFAPSSYPISPGGGGVVPQAAAGTTARKGKSRSTSAIGGIGALVLLAALFGMGGGGSAPGGARAQTAQPNPATGTPRISVNYTDGVPRLTVPRECIIGFFIYRGLSADSTLETRLPLDFQFGTSTGYTDDISVYLQREVNMDAPDDDTSTDPCLPVEAVTNETRIHPNAAPNSIVNLSATDLNSEFTQPPLIPGVQYFYRVRRLTVERRTNTDGDSIYSLNLSNASAAAGPATALIRPQVVRTSGDFNTNFSVTVQGLTTLPNPPAGGGNVGFSTIPAFSDEQIRFIIQLSNDPNFQTGVFEVQQPNRTPEASGEITFNLGAIQATGVDITEPVFVRVGVTNPSDQTPVRVFGTRTDVVFGAGSVGARSVARSGNGRRAGSVGLPGSPRGSAGTRGAGGNRRTPAAISRPR